MQLHEIFPIVIATDSYDSFSQEEKVKLLTSKYQVDRGFSITECTYILDKVPLLKSWIQERLNYYTENVMGIDSKLRITQSWCIMHSGVKQRLYAHRHSNSIISGAFYVAAPDGTEGFTIHKNSAENVTDHPLIDWKVKQEFLTTKPWLKKQETISVEDNKLILFQSNMSHGVYGDKVIPRCVLSFNTWFADGVGDKSALNWLEI